MITDDNIDFWTNRHTVLWRGNMDLVLQSAGVSNDMIQDIAKEEFQKIIYNWMEKNGIDECEYVDVKNFYSKCYQNARATQPQGGQVHLANPWLWKQRENFVQRCKDENKKPWQKLTELGWMPWSGEFDAMQDDEASGYLISRLAEEVLKFDCSKKAHAIMTLERYNLWKALQKHKKKKESEPVTQ